MQETWLRFLGRGGPLENETATCTLAYLISTILPTCSLSLQEKDYACLFMHPQHLQSCLSHSICAVNVCWRSKIVSLLSSLLCNHRFIIFKIQFSIRKTLSTLKQWFQTFYMIRILLFLYAEKLSPFLEFSATAHFPFCLKHCKMAT